MYKFQYFIIFLINIQIPIPDVNPFLYNFEVKILKNIPKLFCKIYESYIFIF